MQWIGALRELLVAACLLYAAYSDIKTREIEDLVWVIMCVLAAPLVFLELSVMEFKGVLAYVFSLYLAFLLGLSVSALGLMGWADFLALSCTGMTILPREGGIITEIPSLAILVNSVLVSLLYPVYILCRNLMIYKRKGKLFNDVKVSNLSKIIAIFTVTKVSIKEYIKRRNFYSIAEVEVGGERKLMLSPKIHEAEFIEKRDGEIWVSPHVPFVAMIALGYLIYVFLGCPLEILLGFRQG